VVVLEQASSIARSNDKEAQRPKIDALPNHSVPYPENPNFVGREEFLGAMEDHLIDNSMSTAGNPARTAFAIWGAPGQGKTQTALKYVFKHKRRYSSILWTFADREQKLLESFSEYAVSLGLAEQSTDLTNGARALMRWYESTGEISQRK
jgi:hypothetical protein